jgi:hypothetical protein
MTSQEWLEWYRNEYTADELQDEVDSLKEQLSIFASQSVGSKSFTRDLEALKQRCNAASRAKLEKGKINVGNSGVTDYSRVNPEADTCGGFSLPDVPTNL